MNQSFLEELSWRGLLYQSTEGAEAALAAESTSGYCGFDPTASSLHIGNLVPVMGLVHLQRSGHRPVALVGGGTGMIGDPSGRSDERNLLSVEQVAINATAIRGQLERFLDFEGPLGARMRDNAEWLMPLGMVDFLRDVGKHFSVNVMLAKESVKSRLEGGISFTEFAYMLLQAYDFLELKRRDGVTLQLGGSDQWGNITAGTELIRRSLGAEAHGVTLPLVTNTDGSKFGKTAAGTSVWLDPSRTSPYKFYQYWINADDRDAGRYLRMFTLLSREEIEALEAAMVAHPELREAQTALAMDVTTRVHGEASTRAAREAARVVFDRKADPRDLSRDVLEMLSDELPHAQAVLVGEGGVSVIDALVDCGLVKSRGEARRQLQ
ncbi:MAG: tyrosine--tRNA ligase, partial [Gemmatimonadaceae bacterium]|nr:tyrosine--tRNA ligase [Gemmatimonadaceae bacterium]